MQTITFSNGCLGSRNDEERSEMRYVMRIALSASHQNFERILHFLRGVCLLECLCKPPYDLLHCKIRSASYHQFGNKCAQIENTKGQTFVVLDSSHLMITSGMQSRLLKLSQDRL